MKRLFLLAAAAGIAVPDAAEADTLHEALTTAYRNNPTLQAARESAEAADENTYQALAGFLPQVSIRGSFGKTDRDTTFGVSPTPIQQHLDPQDTAVEAVQGVLTGGRRIAQLRMARSQSHAAHEDERGAEQEVLLRAVAAYVDVRHAEEVVRIMGENVELLENQVEGARMRFAEGDVTRTDIAQAEARRAAALGEQASAMADLESARAVYAQLIGRMPETLEEPPEAPGLPATLADAVETAIAANPDLRQSRYAARIAHAQISVERSTLLPQFSVVARAFRDREIDGRGVRTEGSSLTAQFSVPLFEGGFGFSRIRQSRRNYERARYQTEEVRRFVVASVTAAWNERLAAMQTVETARTQLGAATFALDGVQQEQLEGQRTTIDVLNAHQEFLAAQLAVVRAERDAYVAAHQLLQAMGGLDPETLGLKSRDDDD